jgi:hypothetical protein
MKHELKMLTKFFKIAWAGDKPFEIRYNDRNFEERDEIVLFEYELTADDYTGREIHGTIDYITDYEQKDNYVVFSYHETGRRE